jgi:hypothetical protein
VSDVSRIEARKVLLGMYPTEYVDAQVMKTQREPVSKSLLEAGYMQTIISVPTARQIRSLCEQDLDPNYLTDLKFFLEKIETDKEEQYIKHCNTFLPYTVRIMIDTQHDVAFKRRQELHDHNEEFVAYIDATGGVTDLGNAQGRTGHITRWEKSHGAPLVWGPLRQSGISLIRGNFLFGQPAFSFWQHFLGAPRKKIPPKFGEPVRPW